MSIRNPWVSWLVILAFLSAFITWQYTDNGLAFAKERISTLLSVKDVSATLVGYRVRLEKTKRTYYVIAVAPGGSSFYKILVLYGPDGLPYEAVILENT